MNWSKSGEKEIHDSFKYSHSGLGGGAAIVIAIIVAYFTAGAASGLVASAGSAAGATTAVGTGGALAAGTGASLAGAGWANLAATAVLTGAAGNAAVSTINNRGNLSAVYKDITSSDAVKGYAVAGVTAGLTAGLYDGWTGTETTNSSAGNAVGANTPLSNSGTVSVANSGSGLSTWSGVGRFAANQALQNTTSAALSKLVGQDGSFSDALQSTLANTFTAAGFNWVGDVTAPGGKLEMKDGTLTKAGLHAVMGGLAAEAMGSDFKTGALAAGVNELLVEKLAGQYGKMPTDEKQRLLVMNSQLIGVMTAGLQGGDVKDMQVASAVTGSATNYNRGLHIQEWNAIAEELSHGDFEDEKLIRAACYEVKCWAEYVPGSKDYNEKFVSDLEASYLGGELSWVRAKKYDGLFEYSWIDKAYDFGSGHVAPVASNSLLLVGGGAAALGGGGICTTGWGCVVGSGMVGIGLSNVHEGASGLASYVNSTGGQGFNPGRYAAEIVSPQYGALIYSGADIATSLLGATVRVPLAMGVKDGLGRPNSIFGVMERQLDNPTLVPIIGSKLPAYTTEGIFLLDAGGKTIDFYKRYGDSSNEK